MAEVRRRLQKTNKDQYTVTIPKTLVQVLGWNAKDQVSFSLLDGKVVLSKIDSNQSGTRPGTLEPGTLKPGTSPSETIHQSKNQSKKFMQSGGEK